TGKHVAKQDTEAAKWYHKAAEQNFAQAELNLGNCYANGQGVAKDDAEAVKWYRKAAEQDFAQAQISLALSYALGQGVAKDYVESYKWTLLAASQGDKDAKETMTILENNMSREQIAEGQKVARNFKPRLAPSAEPDISSTGIAQTRPQSSGTGFFITEDGYLITNEHVAGSEAQVRLATSGAFPQNVSYAVKSSFLLGFLESVPEVAAKLKEPNAKDIKFDDVLEQAKEATALVLVY